MEVDDVITTSKARMGGAPCFKGTRIPVQTLLDYLSDGYTLAEFLSHYPSVSREMAEAYLRLPLQAAKESPNAA